MKRQQEQKLLTILKFQVMSDFAMLVYLVVFTAVSFLSFMVSIFI